MKNIKYESFLIYLKNNYSTEEILSILKELELKQLISIEIIKHITQSLNLSEYTFENVTYEPLYNLEYSFEFLMEKERSLNDVRIEDLNFSQRTYNCLKKININTLQELLDCDIDKIKQIKGLGTKSLKEIKEFILKTKSLKGDNLNDINSSNIDNSDTEEQGNEKGNEPKEDNLNDIVDNEKDDNNDNDSKTCYTGLESIKVLNLSSRVVQILTLNNIFLIKDLIDFDLCKLKFKTEKTIKELQLVLSTISIQSNDSKLEIECVLDDCDTDYNDDDENEDYDDENIEDYSGPDEVNNSNDIDEYNEEELAALYEEFFGSDSVDNPQLEELVEDRNQETESSVEQGDLTDLPDKNINSQDYNYFKSIEYSDNYTLFNSINFKNFPKNVLHYEKGSLYYGDFNNKYKVLIDANTSSGHFILHKNTLFMASSAFDIDEEYQSYKGEKRSFKTLVIEENYKGTFNALRFVELEALFIKCNNEYLYYKDLLYVKTNYICIPHIELTKFKYKEVKIKLMAGFLKYRDLIDYEDDVYDNYISYIEKNLNILRENKNIPEFYDFLNSLR